MKLLNIAGARPNFMKIAPLIHEMRARGGIDGKIIHTGQHYDVGMSEVFFRQLGIPHPDENLEVGSGGREEQIAKIKTRFGPVLLREKPDAVVVVGDVNSTIACAEVATDEGVCVVHVEAGLRSFDMDMPEEVNRIETDRLADLLFVTEPSGMENLAREKVPGDAFLVGNVMIDTLLKFKNQAECLKVHERYGLTPGEYVVGTFHRPSNVDSRESLQAVLDIILYTAEHAPIFLPLHPRTAASLERHGLRQVLDDARNVVLGEPLGYLEFISMVISARCTVTDSGGLQEETTFLKVPCITMRDNTERPVTVEVGSNLLAGTDPAKVRAAIDDVLHGRTRAPRVPELWDGRAAGRIVDILKDRIA